MSSRHLDSIPRKKNLDTVNMWRLYNRQADCLTWPPSETVRHTVCTLKALTRFIHSCCCCCCPDNTECNFWNTPSWGFRLGSKSCQVLRHFITSLKLLALSAQPYISFRVYTSVVCVYVYIYRERACIKTQKPREKRKQNCRLKELN